jgi:hypothetical protein
MPDYENALDEVLEWARKHRPPETIPVEIRLGAKAYNRLIQVLRGQASPGLPSSPFGISRQLLMLTGLPMFIDDHYPANLWAVIDGRGEAMTAGVINTPPETIDGTAKD